MRPGDVPVAWSREATVMLPGGAVFYAFTSHSYVAWVRVPGAHEVVVALPPGAAAKPEAEWHDEVVQFAMMVLATGGSIGILPEVPDAGD